LASEWPKDTNIIIAIIIITIIIITAVIISLALCFVPIVVKV
jgi:hypothetical protein